MGTKKKYSDYAFLSTLLFSIGVFFSLILFIKMVDSNNGITITLSVIEMLSLSTIALAFFIKKKKMVIISFGTLAILYTYYLVDLVVSFFQPHSLSLYTFGGYIRSVNSFSHSSRFVNVRNYWYTMWGIKDAELLICMIIPTAAIILLVVLMLINQIKKKYYKYIWILPAAIWIVFHFVYWIRFGYLKNFSNLWVSFIRELSIGAALVFTGLWISVFEAKTYPKIDSVQAKKGNVQANNDNLFTADRIIQYKELLDSGAITEEEFSEIKKKLLGL